MSFSDPVHREATGEEVAAADSRYPSVGVVIATHNRPTLMRKALESVLSQEYDGVIETIIVFDRTEIDDSLVATNGRRDVRVINNMRTPGLAGARNTGVLALGTDLIAFCDDDDVWLPGKLTKQVERLLAHPGAKFVTTAMEVRSDDRLSVRLAGKSVVTIQDMARSRMAMLHSSSFLFRRMAMLDEFGLVDESMPRSMAEDWDLLLRAARQAPIEHVDEPLVSILWSTSSYFNDAWEDKNQAHEWLLAHHPEIHDDAVGLGLLHSKLAFGHAVLRHRKQALRHALRAARANWREPRWPIALLVVCGVSGKWVQKSLNRRGHGI